MKQAVHFERTLVKRLLYLTSLLLTCPEVVRAATVATPVLSIGTGTYPNPISVTISDATNGVVICYTTDGSTPTESGNLCSGGTTQTYKSQINLGSTATIRAIATLSGYADSAPASATYTIMPAYFTKRNYQHIRTWQWMYNRGYDANKAWLHKHLDVLNNAQWSVQCACGIWTANYAYYPGNSVTFKGDYYVYIHPTSSLSSGTNAPGTSGGASYWQSAVKPTYANSYYKNTNYTDSGIQGLMFYPAVLKAAYEAPILWQDMEKTMLHHTVADYYQPPTYAWSNLGPAVCLDMFDYAERVNPFSNSIPQCPAGAAPWVTTNGALTYNGSSYTDVGVCLYEKIPPPGYVSSLPGNYTCDARGVTVSKQLYFGYAQPFDLFNVIIGTANTGTATYQYCSATSTTNGTCTTWSALTIATDGTSNLTMNGRVNFLPPANWTRASISGTGVSSLGADYTSTPNTSRPKFWVRMTITGGSVTLAQMTGDNWVSQATDAATQAACGRFVTWTSGNSYSFGARVSYSDGKHYQYINKSGSTASSTNAPGTSGGAAYWYQIVSTCNLRSWCGMGSSGYSISNEQWQYNPNPGTVCTAKFEYQARAGYDSNYEVSTVSNYAYTDPYSGQIQWPVVAEKKIAGSLAYQGDYSPISNGVMWDGGGAGVSGAWSPALNYNHTDLYPCSITQTCVSSGTGVTPFSQKVAWAGAYRPATGIGTYQRIQAGQGTSFLQTCNTVFGMGTWSVCDVSWVEQANLNYFRFLDYATNGITAYLQYDTVRDNPNPNNTLVGFYFPQPYIGHIPGSGPSAGCGGGAPYCEAADMSNRLPMFVLALYYMMQPGNMSMYYQGLGNDLYTASDAYAKITGSTTLTAPVSPSNHPGNPASPTVISVADGTQLTNTFTSPRDIPMGCVGTCRIVRLCHAAAAANNTCDQEQNGELVWGNISGNNITIALTGSGYGIGAIVNSYAVGDVVQGFGHGSVSNDWPTDTSPPINWHNVAYWNALFPAVFYNIGQPDTTSGWCGVNAGTACPGATTSKAAASCNKTLMQYPSGCSPGDRDMQYRIGTASSTKTTCVVPPANHQGCAPTWRRDYVNPSTGVKTVVLMRLDSAQDYPEPGGELRTLGRPIDLMSGSVASGGENLFGPYQELFADGSLGTPLHSCIVDGVTCTATGVPNGHQIIQLRGSDGVILVQAK